MNALSIKDGQVSRDNDLCKGCGLCVSGCPEKAIEPLIEDLEQAVAELQQRIKQRIDFETSF
jgi:ferredoxin